LTSKSGTTLQTRQLGNTAIEVSCLGLGTVKIGRNQGVKYPNGFDLPSDAEVRNLLATARDAGINLLDTAPAYGSSEERLGKLLSERDKWVICSKTGEEFIKGQSLFDFSAAHTQLSVERSLRRLKTDYLDLVLIHSDGNDEHIIRQTDCMETLMKLKDKGLIRAFGLSGKTVEGGLLALQFADVVMVTCNPQETAEIKAKQRCADQKSAEQWPHCWQRRREQ
jgi:aryl-alcohol dehydrogenase-like predicted oxidoreductase